VNEKNLLQMRVEESKQRDVGKRRARIGHNAMDYLHVAPGDIIEIKGSKTSCAIVWPSDEDEKNPDSIRLDGQTRKNIGTALGDVVYVKKVKVKTAKTVKLMPINEVVTIDKEFTDFVKNRLKGLPLSIGDEIDAIAPKREEVYGDVEKRVVAQLLALMDGLTERGNVIVLGASNRPDSLDPALRRPGRFDRELEISVPNADGRLEILQIHTRGMPLATDIDLKNFASDLHGYTGADIKSLCRESAIKAIRRYLPEIDLENERIPSKILQSMEIKLRDFYDATLEVIPTAMRQFYVERAKVWWNDVGGLNDEKKILEDNMIAAINTPNKFRKMGVKPPKGVLLYGPPGCGKTLLARALAAECGANMILVRGPEILSKWVGESEKAIREIFRKAKASAPCVIIFDELDSLAKSKIKDENNHGETVLSQMLTEMEDSGTSNIIVVGITNRPDLIDNSMLRNGRLDIVLFVQPPDEKSRLDIIKILTDGMPLANNINLNEIAVSTQNYTGADLASLCREAAVNAMQRDSLNITSNDFALGLKRVRPSITKEIDKWYSDIKSEVSNIIPKSSGDTFYR